MDRRIWTGVVAGVLAAALLLTVGLGAYRAGQDDEAVTRVVTETDGQVVRVVGDGHDWGPRPGFFLIPLLIILLLVLFARGRRHHGWHGPGGGPGWHRGYGWGPGGPGACGPYGGRAVEEGRWEWVPGRRDDPAEPAEPVDPADAVTTPADPPTPRP